MSATIARIGPITEEWLDTLSRCMHTVQVKSFDGCEAGYILDRYREGASPYAVAAELWGSLEGQADGQ